MRNTVRRGAVLALLAAMLPLAACQSLSGALAPLVGTEWQVVELYGQPFVASPGPAFNLRLLPDGHLDGYTGCNRVEGVYQHRGAMLRVGPLEPRRQVCAPAVMARELLLVHAMEGSSHYTLEDGTLSLRNPLDTALIRFRPKL